MPGSGIRAENVVEVVRRTLCRQVHTGAASPANDESIPNLGPDKASLSEQSGGPTHRAVDGAAVSGLVLALREAGLLA
jgi:copper homeostasis protein CutC